MVTLRAFLDDVLPGRIDWEEQQPRIEDKNVRQGGWSRHALVRSKAAEKPEWGSAELQTFYHGTPFHYGLYHVDRDEITPGTLRDRQAGKGAYVQKSTYMTTKYEQAEQYADYTVLLYQIDQRTDAEYLDRSHKVAMIIELDSYEALKVHKDKKKKKESTVRRLQTPKYCQLTALWLHCLAEFSTEIR